MKGPLEISSRNIDLSEELVDLIHDKAEKLDNFHDGIISCRVMVEVPHRSQRKGVSYNVRVDLSVPGGEVIVRREPGEDLYVSICNAFDVAERQLKEHADRQRGDVKRREVKPVGRVVRIFPDDGFGFLENVEGREVYFHENAVLGGKFRDLEVGSMVTFVEREGDEGSQASSVNLA
ncbi:MAG: ribosome-associated translation inhibitor RaiA [Syntrophobacteraceae bacterium]|jgi:ribosomal subunit interface protein|nr:ribosome-associated translation inhibitor RaiA [Syntrophobacteraceae bacterium]